MNTYLQNNMYAPNRQLGSRLIEERNDPTQVTYPIIYLSFQHFLEHIHCNSRLSATRFLGNLFIAAY